jgi:alcohol dehydrogenase
MNLFKKSIAAPIKALLGLAAYFLNFKEPELISGEGASVQVADVLKKRGYLRPLIVTDPGVYGLGLTKTLEDARSKKRAIPTPL